MKKERIYKLEYWFRTTKITCFGAFKNYNEAFKYLYKDKDIKVLNVSFNGWDKWH